MPFVTPSPTIADSAQINAGVIIDSDINAAATIQATKIQALSVGANGGVIPSTGIADAHVAAAAAIAFSKLAALTRGGVLIGSTGNVPTVLAPGNSGDFLKSQGVGADPVWIAGSSDWQQLGETILGSAGSSISVTPIVARKELRFYLWVPSTTAGGTFSVRFNNDSGANYAWRGNQNVAAETTGNSATGMQITFNTGFSNEYHGVFDIENDAAGTFKYMRGKIAVGYANVASGVEQFNSMGVWGNAAAQITRIDVLCAGANFAIGSRLTVFGKKD